MVVSGTILKKAAAVAVVLFLSAFLLNAQQVSKEEAIHFAELFVEKHNSDYFKTSEDVHSYSLHSEKVAYYVVRFLPEGWVMISADLKLRPLIAYSLENQFVPVEEWAESAKSWMKSVEKEMETVLQNRNLSEHPGWRIFIEENLSEHPGWSKITEENALKKAGSTMIEPFIPATWDQNAGWNSFCPPDEEGPGGHALVGCVAVSMAQAMSVFQYPSRPTGNHGFSHESYGYVYVDLDGQPSYNWEQMSFTSPDQENARLLYHAAVTVDMDFSPAISLAYTHSAVGAMKNYFGYSESVRYLNRSSYSDSEWKELLAAELINGRPVIYAGNGNDNESGHAFNIDGVDAGRNYFHINWGWSGNGNGYYSLDALNPGNYNFSYDQNAIIGIKPPAPGPYDITLHDQAVQEGLPVGTPVSQVEIADEFDGNQYNYVLKGRYNVLIDDYGPANFFIENDTLKTSVIFDANSTTSEPLIIEVTDTAGNFYSKSFNISILKKGEEPSTNYNPVGVEISETHEITVYPNPAKDYLNIDFENSTIDITAVEIVNMPGKKCISTNRTENIDVSSLNSGVYILNVIWNDNRKQLLISISN